MLFENNDYNFDYDFLNLAGFNFNRPDAFYQIKDSNEKLVRPEEGLQRGNMWKDEYVPYKGLTYEKIVPTDEKERLLFQIMEMEFAVNDLNLYLDLHPEDASIYEKFKEYTMNCIRLKEEYAKKYGPLTLSDTVNNSSYEWIKNPWPWENDGGSMYV